MLRYGLWGGQEVSADCDPNPPGYLSQDWRGASEGHDVAVGRDKPALNLSPPARRLPADEKIRATRLIEQSKTLLIEQFEAVRLGGGLDLKALLGVTRELARSVARNKHALIGLSRMRSRHEYTYVHSVAVSALMIAFAQDLELTTQAGELLGMAGLLHDIGKSQTPLTVLDKPGPLDEGEWAVVKTHPERGRAILARSGKLHPIIFDVALHHHERLDGSGYPDRLSGEQISLHARMAAICDVYDALTSRRAYKEARPPALVLRSMQRSAGQFDPALLRQFRNVIGAFPVGSVVRLQSGRIGVVLDEVAPDPLSPRVLLLHDSTTRRDLDRVMCETAIDPIIATERPEDWPSAVL